MSRKVINLNKITDINKFIEIAATIPSKIFVSTDEYVVDGKSILGVMSLDLSKDIVVKTEEEYIDKFEQFFI